MAKEVRVRSIRRNRLALAVAAALVPFAQATQAQTTSTTLPTNGQVTAGTATISLPGGNKMQIDQASQKAILQWDSFSIGSAAWVNFTQPSASAIALNRVLGNNPSEIFGRLSANGQVFLSNPSGVLFAPGASVDVGALFATTLSISDSDFLAGRYNFTNAGATGSVINQGVITASGYAALAGPQVRNDGIIIANSGTVALAAGDRVSLDMIGDGLISVSVDQAALNAAAINAGSIQADGGRVILTARSANALLDTVVNNSGVIRANSLVERNGEIVLDGGSAGVVANSGALQGTGASMTMMGDKVNVDPGSSIDASASALTLAAASDLSLNAPIAGSMALTASAGHDMTVASAINVGNTNVDVAGTLRLDAVAQDARLTANGGQTVHAGQLALHAENGHRAVVVNNGGDQAVSVGGGGIALEVVNGRGVAQIANNVGATTNGTQSVQTSGALDVVGGSGSGSSNSGIFQNQTGTQAVSADSITLHGAMSGNNGGAFIRNTNGGGDQTIDVASSIAITGGASGLGNRAGIQTNGNQTISGNADITLTGGSSGSGLNSDNTSNAALISANAFGKTQTINAGNVTLTAGLGGTDTFAAITSNKQTITATGDVRITGGAAGGDSNGARIGAPGSTTVGSDITLKAHDIVLTGGTSSSGAAIGLSGNSGDLPSTIKITASGDVVLNSGSGSGSRIGAPNGSAGGGDIEVNAVNIALNDGAHQTVIRTTGNVKLNASGSISEGANGAVLAHTLSAVAAATANLAGVNQVSSFSGTSGGAMAFTNSGPLSITNIGAGGALTLSNAGVVTLDASGTQDALIRSAGGQSITADGLVLHAQDGRVANINNVGGDQSFAIGPGGIDLDVVNGQGVAQIANNRGVVTSGTQTVLTTGALNVVGGSASPSVNSGVFQMQSGKQSVTAASIALQGAKAPVNTGGAFITNTNGGGDQEINVASGTITVAAGSIGFANRAGVSTAGNQTITGNADIVVSGGNSGNGTFQNSSNSATISTVAGKTQSIDARSITVNAGSGGTDTFATIVGGTQNISTTGDVVLNGGGGFGTANGARIGGVTATNLMLNARNVILNGGTTSGVGLGSSVLGTAQPNTIAVNAMGDVVLNGGTSGTAGARIGSSAQNGTAGGNIAINARGNIALNGGTLSASIRTLGDVTLQAGGSIAENATGLILANALSTHSGSATLLGGANQVASFEATSGGDVSLANTGALQVTGVSALGDATLTNAGAVAVSGPWSSQGAFITTTGTGSDLDVTSGVVANGPMTIDVSGGINVLADGASASGSLSAAGTQTISAGALSITAEGGGVATITQFGGAGQSIMVTGGSIDIQNLGPSGEASITAGNSQAIVLVDGDHLALNGIGGGITQLQSFGSQTVSLTGHGRNALTVGSTGALGASRMGGIAQSITAGASGEQGSITIVGSNAVESGLVGTISGASSQNISTAGTLTVMADAGAATIFGSASQNISAGALHLTTQNLGSGSITNNGGDQRISVGAGGITLDGGSGSASVFNGAGGFVPPTGAQSIETTGTINLVGAGSGSRGIFQSQTGTQTVTAAGISLQAANSGGSGTASISAIGEQVIHVADGAIGLTGGSGGSNNRASISASGNQTIDGNPDITITGGSGGTSNSALITASRTQTISARNITVSAGSGGTDTFGTITGATQSIAATGDVVLNGGGGAGTANGARIGGTGATNLVLSARNVFLKGGTTTGVGLGSSSTAALPNTISVNTTGDVVLNGGASGTAGARIGSSAQTATTGGSISINAGGSIALNGGVLAAAIRTLGNATLRAGGSITENSNGLILANTLTTSSGGSTLLGGPNQIAGFNATSGGDVLLTNTGALNVTGLSAIGSATLDNTGNVTLSGPWGSGGATSITVHSDLVLQNQLTASSVALNATTGSLREEGAGAIEADSLISTSAGDTLLNGANQVSAFTGTSGGVMSLANSGSLAIGGINASGALTLANAGAVSLNADAGQDARITSFGGQTITADQLNLHAQDGRVANITNIGGDQNLFIGAGGIDLNVANGQGVAQISNIVGSGSQTVQTAGALSVVGGSALPSANSGLFQSQSGLQRVNAASISLHGALSGNNGGAFITSNAGGDQQIQVAGEVRITGGEAGFGNRVGIASGGNQRIDAGDIVLTGGSSGLGSTSTNNSNAAFIAQSNPFLSQTLNAASVTLNAGAGGNDTFASITGANQTISATGDVVVNGGSNTFVNGNGSRIGGIRVPATPTVLTLSAHNVILNGGGGASSGAALGGNPGSTQPQTITVIASGDVILNAGSGGAARIGASLDTAPTAGNITIHAGNSIALNGAAQPAAIRTADSLALNAGVSISESGNAFVAASALSTLSGASTALGGANQVSRFNGTSGGDLSLNNTQALQITGATSAGTMSIANAGALTVSGIVSSNGGQTINAQRLAVNADGGVAQLANFGGDQTITVAGGSTSAIDVQTLSGGGFASVINNGGRQSITLLNGDHIAINGAFGAAVVSSSGEQVLSATGNGRNAILLGSAGALGPTNVVASTSQSVTAGLAGESGSIGIVGSAGQNALSGFLTTPVVGGTQTISTAGEISIEGGSAAAQNFNTPAGIFHNGSGQQAISAAGISLTGGDAGNTNAALINALGGGVPANAGNQVFNVGAAGIHITAGSTGSGNRAGIFGSANQTVNVDGDIVITGGAGGSGFAADNSSNNAFISDNGTSGLQTINARNIAINAGADGSDTFAVIVGPHQVITATNDVVLNGGGGFGTSNGARIGGRGGQSTDLSLTARNVMLNGGTTTGAGLGSSGTGTPLPNSVAVHTTGDVVLNAGPGAGVRIGSGPNGLAGGDITVEAGGNIALNGSATQSAAISTTDDVALSATGTISESGRGSIVANALTTSSGGATLLGGPNSVSRFTASAGGDVLFNNTSALLSLGSMSLPAGLSVTQAGDLAIGDASALSPTFVYSVGPMAISASGAMSVRGSDGAAGAGSVLLSDDTLGIQAGSLSLLGGASPFAPAIVSGRLVSIATMYNLQVQGGSGLMSPALILSGTDMSLTVGGELRIDGGSGEGSFGRIATATRDGQISITFPNAASGDYFVDGFEGRIKHGQDGFYTGIKPAKLGDSLIIEYGE